MGASCLAQNLRQSFSAREQIGPADRASGWVRKIRLANLDVVIWAKPQTGLDKPAPLVIFSHGFHGVNTQSRFLMNALADDGYIVVAPNHRDAMVGANRGGGQGGATGGLRPQESFSKPANWTEDTFKDRHDDIETLVAELKQSDDFKTRIKIDWSRVALAGHSLGGYTALGLAGGWPSWKLPGIKAVLALSPYCQPYIQRRSLDINVPVMYLGGTRDYGITPTIKRPGGAYACTSSPCCFVEFNNMGHFSFSNFNRNEAQHNLINHYSLAFLDKYVKDAPGAPDFKDKLDGVALIESK
jgi:predicted dienelactone hydrolase